MTARERDILCRVLSDVLAGISRGMDLPVWLDDTDGFVLQEVCAVLDPREPRAERRERAEHIRRARLAYPRLTRRADGRLEVPDEAELDALFGCLRDPDCIVARGHSGECDSDRDLPPPGEPQADGGAGPC